MQATLDDQPAPTPMAPGKQKEDRVDLLSRIVEQGPAPVMVTDRKGDIVYVNPRFTELTGYSSEEALGKNPRLLSSGRQSPEFYRVLWATILSGQIWHGQLWNKKKNSELYWQAASISALRNHAGEIVGFVAVFEDMTEQKRLQDELAAARNALEEKNRSLQESFERLRELEQLRDDFTHMIVHDLRTPLSSIHGFLHLISHRTKVAKDKDLTKWSERALSATGILIEMVSAVLDVNQMESGELKLNRVECDLVVLIREALATMEPLASGRQLRLVAPEESVAVKGDADLLRRVMVNLVGNALKFTPSRGGEITVGVELEAETVRVSVKDNGPGIPEAYHQKIFEKFGQVRSRQRYSNGLGLPFCKLAVDAHGGQISVESEPGKGSAFSFVLPRTPS